MEKIDYEIELNPPVLDKFKEHMKNEYIPLIESMIEKETYHLQWLKDNGSPQNFIDNSIQSLQHLYERHSDYKDYITK